MGRGAVRCGHRIRFLFFLGMAIVCSSNAAERYLTIRARDELISIDRMAQLVPVPVLLEKVSFSCDVSCDSDELSYVTDLYDGALISAQSLTRSLWHLQQKRKFETISITAQEGIAGLRLHIELVSFWTLAKLKLKGHMIERDKYRQYYALEPTEFFDLAAHQHSLEQIQQALLNQGYCNAEVKSILQRDEATKSVSVTIELNPRKRFHIGHVSVQIVPHEGVHEDDIQLVKSTCVDRFMYRIGHRAYSKAALNKHTLFLKRQLAHQGFLHAEIFLDEHIQKERGVVDVEFKLDVYPKRSFVFLGTQYFSPTYLLDQIMLFGSCANELSGPVLAQEIGNLYYQHGFLSVKIETEQDDQQSIFVIDEGLRTVIKEVVIAGVSYTTSEYIVQRFFSKIMRRNSYSKQLIDQAIQGLMSWYAEHGFFQAKIVAKCIEPRASGGDCLYLDLEEGQRSSITKVTLDKPFENLVEQEPFFVGHQIFFAVDLLAKQRSAIEAEAKKRHILLQEIKPNISKEGDTVQVHWTIVQAAVDQQFGKTIIVGCPDFPHQYLLRELTYKEGDVYDPKRLRQSLMQLKDLDIFETIRLYPAPYDQDGVRPIILKVHKDDPYELRLRGGLGLQQMSTKFTFRSLTYVAGGVFKIKNPLNKADQFKCEADYKRGMHSIVASYNRPWIADYPIAMNIDAYTIQYLQPGWIDTQHNLYSLSQLGFLVGFTHKKQWYSVGFDAGFEWMETKTTGVPDSPFFNYSLARALNFVPALLDHKVPYFMVEPAFMLDLTDSKVNPTKGTFTLLTMKSMIPLAFLQSSSYFVKLFLQHSMYIPLHPFQFLIGIRLGHIFQKDFSSIMPSERFYLGGANSIRSYQTDSCPPLGIFTDKDGKKVFIPQGAKSMANLNVEMRFPLYKELGIALFQDLGVLNNTRFTEIKRESVLAGTGFGLRYNTPIGPLRFDIAWKWRREDPEISRFAWYVTFGSVF